MSEENLQASCQVWDRFLAEDTAAVLELLDPEIEVHEDPELPGASVYHGHDGWAEQIAKFRELFPEIEYRVLERIARGQDVVTVIEASTAGAGSGIPGVWTYAQLERWRDGKVVSISYVRTKEAALEAAGSAE
jgi:ketosteroid isomerase-like protein